MTSSAEQLVPLGRTRPVVDLRHGNLKEIVRKRPEPLHFEAEVRRRPLRIPLQGVEARPGEFLLLGVRLPIGRLPLPKKKVLTGHWRLYPELLGSILPKEQTELKLSSWVLKRSALPGYGQRSGH